MIVQSRKYHLVTLATRCNDLQHRFDLLQILVEEDYEFTSPQRGRTVDTCFYCLCVHATTFHGFSQGMESSKANVETIAFSTRRIVMSRSFLLYVHIILHRFLHLTLTRGSFLMRLVHCSCAGLRRCHGPGAGAGRGARSSRLLSAQLPLRARSCPVPGVLTAVYCFQGYREVYRKGAHSAATSTRCTSMTL